MITQLVAKLLPLSFTDKPQISANNEQYFTSSTDVHTRAADCERLDHFNTETESTTKTTFFHKTPVK